MPWRSAGLFVGVDMGCPGQNAVARRRIASDVVNLLRDDGVLISTTGAEETTLKIRPPLVCTAENVDQFLHALDRALGPLSSIVQ